MNFRFPLFLFFLLLPLLEIYVLIKVGEAIGAIPTVSLVVFTAVLGALLLRHQGFYTLQKVRSSMDRGEAPARPLLEGAILLIGGFLLLLPGFITDVLGLLSLVPAVRRFVIRRFLTIGFRSGPPPSGTQGPSGRPPRTIEGEYRRED
jgi:UPF0716 protein FxsA